MLKKGTDLRKFPFTKFLLRLQWLIIVTLTVILDFPKFDPLTAAGMALCVNLGPKCQNLFPLVSD